MKRPVELQRDVMEELRHDLHANAARIGVTVSEGVVTLVGVVESCGTRLAAQRAAERVPGVKGLANDLEVKGNGTTRCTDGEIAKAALNAVGASMGISDHEVKVTVREGWVVLRGEVDRPSQKIEAEEAVRYLTGVIEVSNTLTIRAQPRAWINVHHALVKAPKPAVPMVVAGRM